MSSWRDDVLALSALYLTEERKIHHPILSDDTPVTNLLHGMAAAGLLSAGKEMDFWYVTDKGRETLKMAIAAQDVLRQVEIFARVDVARSLGSAEVSRSDPNQVGPQAWDPRFADGNPGFDMRLAVLTWLSETAGTGKAFSPEKVVFLQRLGAGQLSVEGFWADAPSVFADIESVASSAYSIDDLQPGDPATSREVMKAVYAAGQIEQQKRDGASCGGCGVPLLMFEREASLAGRALSSCPCCSRVFPPPPAADGGLACPKCSAVIYDGDARCGGCGALLDFSLPAGTVATDTEVVTETVWSSGYGYVSYGWLDPWDPYVDAVFIGGGLYYDPWW